ncbi:protein of unknown function [Pseudomonas inefficax]|uniref:Uncharacterized protein n=1 Tax=Pseudomonas inefficax TaxID=2078786 RepID=A0AAQ1PDP2_9PSED|nr:protein of unknown function [Pseudomonas inefficax]
MRITEVSRPPEYASTTFFTSAMPSLHGVVRKGIDSNDVTDKFTVGRQLLTTKRQEVSEGRLTVGKYEVPCRSGLVSRWAAQQPRQFSLLG